MIAVTAVASRYTVAGRCARSPGFAAAIAYWKARGIVYQDPTPELLAVQAEKRRKGPRPGASFGCLCAQTRLHDEGTTCADCSMDAYSWLRCLLRKRSNSLIWIDDFGTNSPQGSRMRCYFDERPDEIITDGRPSWIGGHG